jgi:hypothetical protein
MVSLLCRRRPGGRFLKKLPREASGPVKHPQKLFIRVLEVVSVIICLLCPLSSVFSPSFFVFLCVTLWLKLEVSLLIFLSIYGISFFQTDKTGFD